MKSVDKRPWWMRVLVATAGAFVCAWLAEGVYGRWDPLRVGWSNVYAPLIIEGGVFGFLLGGWPGVVLAPLPLLLTPETWVRVRRLTEILGPAGTIILYQPLPALWAGAIAGAVVRALFNRQPRA
jgi:hypothetical protein